MLQSMTGYGRGEKESAGLKCLVELRSVNHRFLELALNLPKNLWPLEDRCRQVLKSRLARGRVEMQLNFVTTGGPALNLRLDGAMAGEVHRLLEELKSALDLAEPLRLDHLLHFSELIIASERAAPAPEETWQLLAPALEEALAALQDMRRQEGAALQAEMLTQIDLIDRELGTISAQAAALPELWRQKMLTRLQELLAEPVLDQTRLGQEIALLADRRDISEELTRLASHLAQCRQALQSQEPVGRRLEFLFQEMLREINTIGAKGGDVQISQAVLVVKGHLEKLREQVQNVE